MHTKREESPLAEQSLKSSTKLDLGDGESVSEVEGAVHVGEGEVSEPFWILFTDFCKRESFSLLWRWCGDLEDVFVGPSLLVFAL